MSRLSISAFSAKDKDDLMMGLEEEIDFVALSFVRSADDLVEITEIIKNSKAQPKLIAKIEKPQAVNNIHKILENADGVMVARGDLGVEVPLEKVPIIQKDVIRTARDMGKIVITATQMLTSMVASPHPTRGETSDVANAVLDGTDAIMLSEETASGNYPVQACAMLGRIAAATEPYIQSQLSRRSSSSINAAANVSLAVGRSAGWLAADINAAAIVAYTRSGFTAYAVSQFRPECPIIALTPNEKVCRQLALCWGTTAIVTKLFDDTDDMFIEAKKIASETGIANKGDRIILTAGVPMGKAGSTTLIRVLEI
jgi:pyruvate kinase